MNARSVNWPLWSGFLLALFAMFSYPFVFVRFPATRDFPWANLLLFAVSAWLLAMGLRRAFSAGSTRGKKITGSVLATLSAAVLCLFLFSFFVFARRLPASSSAPQVGQTAPEFRLADTQGKPVSLTELRSSPIDDRATKGVLLIFYRGYW